MGPAAWILWGGAGLPPAPTTFPRGSVPSPLGVSVPGAFGPSGTGAGRADLFTVPSESTLCRWVHSTVAALCNRGAGGFFGLSSTHRFAPLRSATLRGASQLNATQRFLIPSDVKASHRFAAQRFASPRSASQHNATFPHSFRAARRCAPPRIASRRIASLRHSTQHNATFPHSFGSQGHALPRFAPYRPAPHRAASRLNATFSQPLTPSPGANSPDTDRFTQEVLA